MTTISKICLRHKATKELLCYDTDEDGNVSLELNYGTRPIWQVDTVNEALVVLAGGPPWTLSTMQRPALHNIKASELEVVRREVIEEIYPVPTELPPVVSKCFDGVKPTGVLRRYAGTDQLPADATTLMLFELPETESVESMRRFVGRILRWKSSFEDALCTLYAVFDVPEDYVSDLEGKRGFAAVTSTSMY